MDATKTTTVTLIQPLGVDPFIFPWGIHSLEQYLRNSKIPVNIDTWMFSNIEQNQDIYGKYKELAQFIFESLKWDGKRNFKMNSDPVFGLFSVLAVAGEAFFDIAKRHRLSTLKTFSARTIKEIKLLAADHAHLVMDRIKSVARVTPEKRQIWAFSVYDRTVYWCLSVAKMIKKHSPGSLIIFGGDYFIFRNAKHLITNCSWIDAVVVGYGEEVFLKIVEAVTQNESISALEIQGLVNLASLKRNEAGPGTYASKSSLKLIGNPDATLQVINIPNSYREPESIPLISYVQMETRPEIDVIHVLIQRGCSFGQCTFCTQIDKFLHFPLNRDHVFSDLSNLFGQIRRDHTRGKRPILIRFDADEHPAETFISILDYFQGSDSLPDDIQIYVTLWYQVKFVSEELGLALARFCRRNVHVTVALNFESLNPNSLKLMKKGHSPLKCIEAAKTVLDTGHDFHTNYLIHFPLETENSVAVEFRLLRDTLHLVEGRISLFPYIVNSRDDIYQHAKRYGVSVIRHSEDIWCKETFGIDLEFTFWGYSYKNLRRLSLDSWLRWAWLELLKSGEDGRSTGWRRGVLASISLFSGRFSFLRRRNLVRLLSKHSSGSDEQHIATSSTIGSRLAIEQQGDHYCLTKDYKRKGYQGAVTIDLNDTELSILRYLYRVRTWAQLVKQFSSQLKETELREICKKHQKIGSIVEFDNRLISTANDPGYWRNEMGPGSLDDMGIKAPVLAGNDGIGDPVLAPWTDTKSRSLGL